MHDHVESLTGDTTAVAPTRERRRPLLLLVALVMVIGVGAGLAGGPLLADDGAEGIATEAAPPGGRGLQLHGSSTMRRRAKFLRAAGRRT